MSGNGCLEYTKATADIFFEPDHVSCACCPMLGGTERRPQCNRTGEYIIDTRMRGMWCALKIESEENNG